MSRIVKKVVEEVDVVLDEHHNWVDLNDWRNHIFLALSLEAAESLAKALQEVLEHVKRGE